VNNFSVKRVITCVTTNYKTMKKLITAIAIGAFAFVGTALESEARPYGGRGYQTPASTIYVSGYHHGRPIYTQKYFIGYDSCGRPRFGYRTVSAPVRHYQQPHCDTRYSGHSYNQGYSQRSGYYDDRRRSGASVSFSFRR
jgi:hypothetical protein